MPYTFFMKPQRSIFSVLPIPGTRGMSSRDSTSLYVLSYIRQGIAQILEGSLQGAYLSAACTPCWSGNRRREAQPFVSIIASKLSLSIWHCKVKYLRVKVLRRPKKYVPLVVATLKVPPRVQGCNGLSFSQPFSCYTKLHPLHAPFPTSCLRERKKLVGMAFPPF